MAQAAGVNGVKTLSFIVVILRITIIVQQGNKKSMVSGSHTRLMILMIAKTLLGYGFQTSNLSYVLTIIQNGLHKKPVHVYHA